jgi:hypothetical protein
MYWLAGGLDLIGVEESSWHHAGEVGIYLMVIKVKPNTILR